VNGLPAGCTLAQRKPVIGFSQPVGIDTNPWRGDDRSVVASIREVMYEISPRVVDGPPLDSAQLSRFFGRLSQGINDGYVAVYTQQGAEELSVYALTFANAARLPNRPNDARINVRRAVWFEGGKTAIALHGDDGLCSRAIQSHLESVAH
jgi:hypothetical protein